MIGKPAMLVESENKQGLIPLRTGAKSLINALHENLAVVDGRRRVEGLDAATLWVDPGKLRQPSCFGIGVELG
jgi:hypothetical protein